MLGHVAAELAACPEKGSAAWWAGTSAVVDALLDARPDAVLELAERRLTGPLPGVLRHRLGRLLAVDAGRVVRLLLADPERVAQVAELRFTKAVRCRLAGLSDAELGALLAATGPAPRPLEAVLRALPPVAEPPCSSGRTPVATARRCC